MPTIYNQTEVEDVKMVLLFQDFSCLSPLLIFVASTPAGAATADLEPLPPGYVPILLESVRYIGYSVPI